ALTSALAAARRTARSRVRLARANERAGESPIDIRRQPVDIEPAFRQELPRIVEAIHSPRLDVDLLESREAKLLRVLRLFQRAGDAANPELHAPARIVGH